MNSAVLKGYKLSSYTSASGSEVTRIELELGSGVSLEVSDKSDGLQVLLSSGGTAAAASAPAASTASSAPSLLMTTTAAAAKPAVVETAKPSRPAPETAAPVAKTPEPLRVAAPPHAADHPERPAAPNVATNALATIRSISVQRGQGTLDVIIDGPNSAHPFELKILNGWCWILMRGETIRQEHRSPYKGRASGPRRSLPVRATDYPDRDRPGRSSLIRCCAIALNR